ncbi:MAG: hypothetical protein KKC46_22205 [Proteobacteria bacterium]|nr:hypothetical protein [Pseudomonadota bacterium]
MAVKLGKMKGAGPYYGKTLDELNASIGWSPEEEREIERYCEKIHKNISEEEMTPMERFKATMEGKERDRLLVETFFHPSYAMRTLDGFADAVKSIDAYYYPKLLVKSHLATTARYKMERMFLGPISYGEELFGTDSMFIENGNPVHEGDLAIKTIEDLEGLEAPDPTKHGMFAQYLWFCQEVRRIFDKYDLSNKMPIEGSFCEGPDGYACCHMMGYNQYLKYLRKNPEFCKKAANLASDWLIKLGTAVTNLGKVDYSYMCSVVGMYPIKGTEWIAGEYARIGKAVKAAVKKPIVHAWAFNGAIDWLDELLKAGALGEDSFDGVMCTGDITDYNIANDFLQKNNLYGCYAPSDKLLVSGPMSKIEEEIKGRCDAAKKIHNNRCTIGLGAIDYYTTPEHLDASIAAAMKYAKI